MKPVRTWVLIADGGHARVLEIDADRRGLEAQADMDMSVDLPRSHEIVSDRRARSYESRDTRATPRATGSIRIASSSARSPRRSARRWRRGLARAASSAWSWWRRLRRWATCARRCRRRCAPRWLARLRRTSSRHRRPVSGRIWRKSWQRAGGDPAPRAGQGGKSAQVCQGVGPAGRRHYCAPDGDPGGERRALLRRHVGDVGGRHGAAPHGGDGDLAGVGLDARRRVEQHALGRDGDAGPHRLGGVAHAAAADDDVLHLARSSRARGRRVGALGARPLACAGPSVDSQTISSPQATATPQVHHGLGWPWWRML